MSTKKESKLVLNEREKWIVMGALNTTINLCLKNIQEVTNLIMDKTNLKPYQLLTIQKLEAELENVRSLKERILKEE